VSRKIGELIRVLLVARAAGQCEFPGCRRYLFEHHLTKGSGNFAECAHIVPFREGGPRGRAARPKNPKDVHSIDNLLLLCPEDHKEVDDHPEEYSAETLGRYKDEHEGRVRHLIGLSPHLRTVPLQLKGRIAGQPVDIPVDDITRAIAPRYPASKPGMVIDLNGLDAESKDFYRVGAAQIRQCVREFYGRDEVKEVRHVSVFALAPIPLLVCLGNCLSSTIPVDLYQRHRSDESWVWRNGAGSARFKLIQRRSGTDSAQVALLLSLSGSVDLNQLPARIDERFSVYEIRSDRDHHAMLVETRGDLDRFRAAYHRFLGKLTTSHPNASAIHLFPAVPAPVAVLCGRELLRKKHPRIHVWDLKKKTGQYVQSLTVN